ncbi:hypothetical protein FPV67DRAFT_210219 [Lyophyllum atratum]|nr:hypothetical protein FPV67DRAFT_210219 [Lyophyllum atratum]
MPCCITRILAPIDSSQIYHTGLEVTCFRTSSLPPLPSMDNSAATDVPSNDEAVDEDFLSFFKDRRLEFQILILGRANAGKTTILERLTGASIDKAEVRRDGELLDGQTIKGQSDRGLHNVEDEIRFPSRPGFVFHDSRGFEAGSSKELSTVQQFVEYRSSKAKVVEEQLHAIWMCLPLDDSRELFEAEKEPFCWSRGDTPLVIIFTKRDGAISKATQNIIGAQASFNNSRASRKQARIKAETEVTEHVKKRQEELKQLSGSKAALVFITTSDMQENTHKTTTLCDDLIKITEQGLSGPRLKTLLTIVWHRNILQSGFWSFYWTFRTNAKKTMLGSSSPSLHAMATLGSITVSHLEVGKRRL